MKRILIAEDDRFMANVCRQKFEEVGYQVAVALDGHQAIEELVRNPPDALLLDLMLPGIDGLGVLGFLRSRENLCHLPVIVVSNSDYFSGVVQAAWAAGATQFMNKGDCSPMKLIDEVAKLIVVDSNASPTAPATVNPQPATRPPPPQRTHDTAATRVLIADDDKLIHGVLSFFLTQAGFIVKSAFDGRQALEMAIAQAPDLLVLDGMMPELDGYQVLERWCLHPVLSTVPVIMLTGTEDQQKKAIAIGQGVVAYLTKPFSPDDLVKKVKHYAGRH
ncbi:MAG: response regulator [Luteolibacter sp.]|uniref:response regulator n=1 Tax=Luteolibacter sp. TaxID=1962973 RepID=UPI003264E2AC